jgi:hypothetical protein
MQMRGQHVHQDEVEDEEVEQFLIAFLDHTIDADPRLEGQFPCSVNSLQ